MGIVTKLLGGLTGGLLGGGRNMPKPPPIPRAPAAVPQPTDPAVLAARAAQRKQAGLLAAGNNTILTSPGGLTSSASTAKKTVLGV